MNRYLHLLSQHAILRRLSQIQLLAYFGAWFTNVAIYTLLLEMGVSATVIALTAVMHFLPGVLQAPFTGALIDRFEPKRVMVLLLSVEIMTTLMLLMVTEAEHLWLLYLLIFVRMAASSFYFTLEMALLPRILNGADLQAANEIHSIIWSLSYTVGMAVSGLVVYQVGVRTAFVIDALLFMVGLILLFPLSLHVKQQAHHLDLMTMMGDTIRYMRENPVVFYLLILHAFVGLTAFDALVALMVERYYASFIAASLAIGLLHASRALGLVIGPMWLGKRINHKMLVWLFVLQAVSIWIWASVMEHFYASLAASVLVGFSTTTLWSYTYTLLQHHTHEYYYGRVVAYNDMLFLLSAAGTSMMIGVMADGGIALEWIAVVMGSGFVVAALYFGWMRRRFELKEPSQGGGY
ncbi:MAG: MFS transporter [Campylobacterales bacterium]|nr:MFS transporter [Campylobacterales bacterium]